MAYPENSQQDLVIAALAQNSPALRDAGKFLKENTKNTDKAVFIVNDQKEINLLPAKTNQGPALAITIKINGKIHCCVADISANDLNQESISINPNILTSLLSSASGSNADNIEIMDIGICSKEQLKNYSFDYRLTVDSQYSLKVEADTISAEEKRLAKHFEQNPDSDIIARINPNSGPLIASSGEQAENAILLAQNFFAKAGAIYNEEISKQSSSKYRNKLKEQLTNSQAEISHDGNKSFSSKKNTSSVTQEKKGGFSFLSILSLPFYPILAPFRERAEAKTRGEAEGRRILSQQNTENDARYKTDYKQIISKSEKEIKELEDKTKGAGVKAHNADVDARVSKLQTLTIIAAAALLVYTAGPIFGPAVGIAAFVAKKVLYSILGKDESEQHAKTMREQQDKLREHKLAVEETKLIAESQEKQADLYSFTQGNISSRDMKQRETRLDEAMSSRYGTNVGKRAKEVKGANYGPPTPIAESKASDQTETHATQKEYNLPNGVKDAALMAANQANNAKDDSLSSITKSFDSKSLGKTLDKLEGKETSAATNVAQTTTQSQTERSK